MLVSPKKDCPHISNYNFLPLEEFKNLSFKNLKCECCSEVKELWICINCGKAFCGRYVNNHYYSEHYSKNKVHCICISMLDLSVWCYECMTEGYNDPGSYIESDISSKYVKIISDFKFGDSNSISQNNINSTLDLTKDEITKIKYDNFIELLKNFKFNNISFLVGPEINLDKDTKRNLQEIILEKLKKMNSNFEKINLENLFSKELFLSNPNILYSFLRELKLNEKEYIKPNIIHYFIRYLIENTYGSYIFSENFEGIELNSGIPSENIVLVKGNLLEGHCAKCNKKIELDIINKGIQEDTIVKCDICDGPCKPKIFLRGDEINQYFYEQTKNILSSKLIFIIGTDLSTMPFKDISKILNTTKPWIVEINQKEVGDFKFNELSNNELFLEGNCEDIIKKIINDCGWNEEDIKNYSPNKSKYCNLEDFENFVLKEHQNKENYYILSSEYFNIENDIIFLSKLSIFDIEKRGTIKKDKETVSKILDILKNEKYISKEKSEQLEKLQISELEKKAIGSMMGMAIGDAMGSRYEFEPVDYEKQDLFDMGKTPGGAFFLEPGQWTDDTSMGLCLADSLLVNNGNFDPHDLIKRFIAWLKGGYNNAFRFNEENGLYPRGSVGLGGNISMALYRYIYEKEAETQAGDEYTSGNGSIMRNAAIPICFYYNIDLACEKAKKQSLTTHQGHEARECCSLLTYIIVKILNIKDGQNIKTILDSIGDEFKTDVKSVEILAKSGKDQNNDWNWKAEKYFYNEQRAKMQPGYIGSYAMDNLSMSLHIIYNTSSFKEAIIKAVNLRGDSDSVASVVGQIAGAYYPLEDIPYDWIESINKWDKGEIALRGYMLSRLHENKSKYNS